MPADLVEFAYEDAPLPIAIGVVYRPEMELASHYFHASLLHQFDEYIWFDETRAVVPLVTRARPAIELPDTYPFGLSGRARPPPARNVNVNAA